MGRRTTTQHKIKPRDSRTRTRRCSPYSQQHKIAPNSCFTAEALREIQPSTQPVQTLASLQTTYRAQCQADEACLLDAVLKYNPRLQHKLKRFLFAPEYPRVWDTKPTTWLTNFDIESVLKQYEVAFPQFKLFGPTSIDYDTQMEDGQCVETELCKLSLKNLKSLGKTKLGIVFNLDKHDEPGSHWTSMFLDLDNAFVYYYDSALNPVPPEVKRLEEEIVRQGAADLGIQFRRLTNRKTHQKSNTECGMYALYFIITLLTATKRTLPQRLKLFSESDIPDRQMQKKRSVYFNAP
jgi:hypothetical protein